MINEKLAYAISEAVAVSGQSRTGLYAAIKSGSLIARKRGSRTVILADDLRRWLDSLPVSDLAVLLEAVAAHDTSSSGEYAEAGSQQVGAAFKRVTMLLSILFLLVRIVVNTCPANNHKELVLRHAQSLCKALCHDANIIPDAWC